jgi:hypothetical protein
MTYFAFGFNLASVRRTSEMLIPVATGAKKASSTFDDTFKKNRMISLSP